MATYPKLMKTHENSLKSLLVLCIQNPETQRDYCTILEESTKNVELPETHAGSKRHANLSHRGATGARLCSCSTCCVLCSSDDYQPIRHLYMHAMNSIQFKQ